MTMKKVVTSRGSEIVIGSSSDSSDFQPGHRFMLGDTIYTVAKSFKSDNTWMRRLITSRGDVQDVTVETLKKDQKEPDYRLLKDVEPPAMGDI